MVSTRWPLPSDQACNDYELVGRYIAQTILMERFVDMALLIDGAKPRDLKRAKLSSKIGDLTAFLQRPDNGLQDEWQDVPGRLTAVARHRNLFAHRMMDRAHMPSHLTECWLYERLSNEDRRAQEVEAFDATEAMRGLYLCLSMPALNPGLRFTRTGVTNSDGSPVAASP